MTVDLILAVVVSRREEALGLRDLLSGVRTYLRDTSVATIVLENACDAATLRRIEAILDGRSVLLHNDRREPMRGGMYYSISKCAEYALRNYAFELFLKADPDTLFTGPGLVAQARRFLGARPKVGLLGSYRHDCNGKPRDFSCWEPIFAREETLWQPFLDALHGSDYVPGEHPQGGAMLFTRASLEKLRTAGLLAREDLRPSALGCDVILALLARFLGIEIASFVDPGQPFAIAYRGLPLSIGQVRHQRRAVVHSVKFGSEDRLRRLVFRVLRLYDRWLA